MSRGRHRKGGRTTPRGTRPSTAERRHGHVAPPFFHESQAALRERSPLDLLSLASMLVEATTPRPLDSWPGEPVQRPDGPSTFQKLAVTGTPGMRALVLAVATLHADELLARRLRDSIGFGAMAAGPAWLISMDDISITETAAQPDPLGDGENLLIGWRWPDGQEATMIAYVDFNMGTIVKDAFAIAESMGAVRALYLKQDGEHGTGHVRFQPVSRAAVRARLEEAISIGERMVPSISTETWPACRPMLEWLLRRLPAGGTSYIRPDWPEDRREELLDDFITSPHAAIDRLDATEVRELADPLVWFGCDYGPGDPLRWSPVSVEIVLADWYPRKVFALPDDLLRRLPDVLAAFIAFTAERRPVPPDLLADTLDAVPRWTPAFHEGIATPGRSPLANATRLGRIAAGLDPDDFDDDDQDIDDEWRADDPDARFEFTMRDAVDSIERNIVEQVGGRAAYDALDDAPLADAPFDWSGVPADMQVATAETLAQLDLWAGELFDPEVRTIARAVLAAVVRTDRSVFRRSARTDALAAGVLAFVITRLLRGRPRMTRAEVSWKAVTQKDLAQATGVSTSTIAARGRTIAGAVERAGIDGPSLLHSNVRRQMLQAKQVVEDWRADHPE